MRLLSLVCLLLFTALPGHAQFRYFGSGSYGRVKTTSRWGIPYDDGDFQSARPKTIAKGIRRLNLLGASQREIDRYLWYPQADMSETIDKAYDQALAVFIDCGGSLADKARAVDPSRYFVQVEPTIWQTSSSPTGWAAGETIPSTRLIRAVNYYFSESQHQLQWLPDLMLWEQLNHIAIETGVSGEPGSSPSWPCDGGPH